MLEKRCAALSARRRLSSFLDDEVLSSYDEVKHDEHSHFDVRSVVAGAVLSGCQSVLRMAAGLVSTDCMSD